MSIYVSCPKCGADGKSLLNLVSCASQACRNYCPKWENEWKNKNRPRFRNNSSFGTNHTFLGNFTSRKGILFDLYHTKSYGGDDVCLARFGDSDDQCYYVDGNESDIGIISQGSVKLTDAGIGSALKRALEISRNRKLITRTP